jgi:SAM-dependent methyltransferase
MIDESLIFKRKDLRFHVSDDVFSIVRCRKCKMVYVNPRPTEKEIHDFYTDEFYEANIDAQKLLQESENLNRLKFEYVKDINAGHMLEIGPSKGEYMFYMKTKGWQVKGIEFSGKPPNLFNLDIYYGVLSDAGLPPRSFDLITMWAVLEHVYNPLDLLRNVSDLLKPGGRFVALVTNFRSIPARFLRHDDIPRHTNLFTRKTLSKALNSSGLVPENFYFNHELYGGSHRGLFNYSMKLLFGESLEQITAQNRLSGRWGEFSSELKGKPSFMMKKIDRWDIKLSPYIDRIMDKLNLGFLMIVTAKKQ